MVKPGEINADWGGRILDTQLQHDDIIVGLLMRLVQALMMVS